MESITEGPYRPFQETTPGALNNKEYFVVELGAPKDSAQLFTATSGVPAIGVLPDTAKRAPDDTTVSVRLLGKGGTLKVKASGVINKGDRVKAVSGGTVVATTTTGDRTIGIKFTQGACASGDVIEIYDVVEKL